MPKNSVTPRKPSNDKMKPLHLTTLGGITCVVFLTFLLFIVIGSKQIQSYHIGSCTILSKQLLYQSRTPPDPEDDPDAIPIYVPTFQFLVQTADGHHYRAQGYEYDPGGDLEAFGAWDHQDYGQSIIDTYSVGETYPCWYDPTDPTQAVLTQHIKPALFSWPIWWTSLGGIILLCGLLWASIRACVRAYRRHKIGQRLCRS